MYVDEIRAYTPQNEQEAADQRLILEYIRLFPDNIQKPDCTRKNRQAKSIR